MSESLMLKFFVLFWFFFRKETEDIYDEKTNTYKYNILKSK